MDIVTMLGKCVADEIEALQAENAKLEAERDEARAVARDYHYYRRPWSIEAMPWLEEEITIHDLRQASEVLEQQENVRLKREAARKYDHPQDVHQDEQP
jgi:hypothetical protein